MEDDLKYLILGYRKYTGKSQKEIAMALGIPFFTYTALEMGTFKQPSPQLLDRIENLTEEFNQDDLKFIGRGYRIKDKLGPDFKYFIRGLKEEKGINPHELDSMPSEECLKTIGSVDMDEYDVVAIGRTVQ